jgi:DNA-binding transcriptional ArsR family regulator
MPANPRPPLVHPDAADLTVYGVLHALADPTRLVIVRTLRNESERPCGTFPVQVAPSTLTHHFRILREAGVIRQREEGNRRWTTLRRDDLDARFPGLVDSVLAAADHPVRARKLPTKRSRGVARASASA